MTVPSERLVVTYKATFCRAGTQPSRWSYRSDPAAEVGLRENGDRGECTRQTASRRSIGDEPLMTVERERGRKIERERELDGERISLAGSICFVD